MSASKEKVVLTPVDFEQGKSLLEHQEDQNQSKRCVKMESKIKVIIGFFVCATVIAISMGLAFGIDWSKSEEPPAPPPISEETIELSVTNYLKIQDPKIGKDYFKFVPTMKGQGAQTNITFKQFLESLSSNQQFLDDFIQVLRTGTNFNQYYFECAPIKKSTLETQGFEFVLKSATDLANRTPDYEVFEDELENCQGGSVSFDYGLRKDSTLVCPCVPENEQDQTKYTHLAIFAKEAPKAALDSVFKKTAQVMAEKVNQSSDVNQKWFLSTDGSGGSAWLHVRIGKKAKYYSFDEYRFSD